MQAFVYKSTRQAETFVYLRERDAFDLLPETLRQRLGGLAFVLDVALTPERQLAREDAARVCAQLLAQGWYLQLPPPPVPPLQGADG